MKRLFIILLFSAFTCGLHAQGFLPKYDKNNKPTTMFCTPSRLWTIKNAMNYEVVQGDTIYLDQIPEVRVFYKPKNWRKSKQWRDYYKLVWNFKKVYPYVLKAKAITMEADSVIQFSNFSKRERTKYIDRYEKKLFKEFEKPLKNLSITQGKLLLKLLDRELGQSSFYIIKGYKGGITAGFWQGVAKLFGSDLKVQYDRFGKDKEVEELVKMYQQGSFYALYYSMFDK